MATKIFFIEQEFGTCVMTAKFLVLTVNSVEELVMSPKIDRKMSLGAVALMLFLSESALALPSILTSVTRIAVEPGRWGGCAVRLATNPATVSGLETCGNWYVSFDCEALSGENTKSEAQSRLQQAQLAFVSGYRLYVEVDPSVELNGVCYATRADVLP